jgi:hypothetical protein
MLPAFLVPETTVGEEGDGPAVELGSSQAKSLLLTLGITRIIEQESLNVSIWGSSDQANWGPKPLLSFPQKFYCGTYQIRLDLSQHPDVKFVKVSWRANRWGHGDPNPLFGIYLFAQEAAEEVLTVTG